MMEKLKKYFTLQCLREINNKEIHNSAEQLQENKRVFNKISTSIDADNSRIVSNSPIDLTEQLADIKDVSIEDMLENRRKVSNLENSSLNSVDRIDLEREMVNISYNHTRTISMVIASYLGFTSPDQDRKNRALKFLFDRNQLLSDKHKINIENGDALKSKAEPIYDSLVEDFANPNTEMPSYMDPED